VKQESLAFRGTCKNKTARLLSQQPYPHTNLKLGFLLDFTLKTARFNRKILKTGCLKAAGYYSQPRKM
jgi:hypothetical protein